MSSKQELLIDISPEGEVKFIYDDLLAGLLAEGEAVTQRVSHVEPSAGGWTADLSPVNGPVLGPYKLRQEALDAEVAWLKQNLF